MEKRSNKTRFYCAIYKNGLSEKEALEIEIKTIEKFTLEGIKLVNLTKGGDGVSGLKHSSKSKMKMAEVKVGKKRGPLSESTKIKIGNGNRNKVRSAETIAKLSAAKKGKPISKERHEILIAKRRGAKNTKEHREALLKAISKEVWWEGVQYSSIKELAFMLGVKPGTLAQRVRKDPRKYEGNKHE